MPSNVGGLKLFLVSIFCPHRSMANGRLVFSYVVTIDGRPRSPVMAKLLLRFSTSQPAEKNVHGFGPPWGDGVAD